jgi:hypothetical protein
MRKFICLFLFVLNIAKVEAQEASDEILSKIVKAEIALKEKRLFDQRDLNEIVCLTNIETKNGDGNYFGISFFPSESEIQLWKDWFEKNKSKISYSIDSEIYNKDFGVKIIQVEYESGKFRNNVCEKDKTYQDWLKQNEKK